MRKKLSASSLQLAVFLLPVVYYFLFAAFPAQAVCPVCTVAVGGGILLSHYFGVDDLVIGVWAGGLIISLGLWTATFIKKNYFKGQSWFLTGFLWLTTVIGLKQAGFIGHPTCKIHGHDKLLSGMVFGSIAFLIGFGLDLGLRKINKKNPGKVFFPYQKVILPLGFLILATVFATQLCRFGIKP